MEYLKIDGEFPRLSKSAVTLGKFDGIHRGHQNIHSCPLKDLAAFFFCKDHLTADTQRKKNGLQTFFLLFQDLLYQVLGAAMDAVKFSKCNRTL